MICGSLMAVGGAIYTQMNVGPLLQSLGAANAELERRAGELMRKMQVKLPTLGNVSKLHHHRVAS